MHKKVKPLKHKVRKARIKKSIKDFFYFLKHPVKIRKITETEKRLKKKIKHDIRQRRFRKIYGFPTEVVNSIRRFWKYRKIRAKELFSTFSDFFKLLKYINSYKELKRDYFKTFINSTTFFVLSFIIVYYIYQFVTLNTARAFDIPYILCKILYFNLFNNKR